LSSILEFLHIEVGEVSSALAFGLLLALGLFGGRLAKRLGLPAITGYLVFGILLNPYVTNRIDPSHHYFNPEIIEQLVDLIEIIALSYIAYIIGGSLRLDTLRGLGKSISSITLIQGAVPFIFVFLLVAFIGPFVAPPNMLVGSNS
jgi:Kef-type K+ transport system membrane component KefB